MAKYFTFKELITTSTNIDNVPNWDSIANLALLSSFLDTVRTKFKKPIRVTSGFRSPEVNKAVGGSSTSSHMRGLAADIQAYSGKQCDNEELKNILVGSVKNLDQLGIYTTKDGKYRWFHVGLKTVNEKQRNQIYTKIQ